jgi:hypothetical protein
MRHFSQHQNQVIFLFTGAYSFAELKKSNWIKYFPHSVPIKLDYLSKENTIRLTNNLRRKPQPTGKTRLYHKSQRKMANASTLICDGVRKTIAFPD